MTGPAMPRITVTSVEDGPWNLTIDDGEPEMIAPEDYDALTALEIAEADARLGSLAPIAWRRIPGGFEATTDPRTALLALGDELAEANTDGDSSNDLIQIVDSWFTENGLPTFLYR